MNNEVNTTPVILGEPMWEGEVTYSMAQLICAGLERIKPEHLEAVMKRFAFEWLAMRQENAQLRAEGDRLPADWIKDSSLETWFPFTAEEMVRLKAENATLRADLARMQAPVTDELMEELAALEHERWSNQAIAALTDMTEARRERWTRQASLPYAGLTESEKEQDRKQVNKTLTLLAERGGR